jgi:5-carboxymethyl-2-hydroxymuconate isomerase
MPHLILEYSDNVIEKNNFTDLFAQCHDFLAANLPTEIASCKSRAIGYSDYYVSGGQAKNAFVHVTLKILSGRSVAVLNKVGHQLLDMLNSYFVESHQHLQLQISLEIADLSDAYFKSSGPEKL